MKWILRRFEWVVVTNVVIQLALVIAFWLDFVAVRVGVRRTVRGTVCRFLYCRRRSRCRWCARMSMVSRSSESRRAVLMSVTRARRRRTILGLLPAAGATTSIFHCRYMQRVSGLPVTTRRRPTTDSPRPTVDAHGPTARTSGNVPFYVRTVPYPLHPTCMMQLLRVAEDTTSAAHRWPPGRVPRGGTGARQCALLSFVRHFVPRGGTGANVPFCSTFVRHSG